MEKRNIAGRQKPTEQQVGSVVDGSVQRYYGRSAVGVAEELFGKDFSGLGVLYSEVDGGIPHKIEFRGKMTTIRDTNMITGNSSGFDGLFEGAVISEHEAILLTEAALNRQQDSRAA